MLRSPRPLPSRFRRPITPATRILVERRLRLQRSYKVERLVRTVQVWRRRVESMKRYALPTLLWGSGASLLLTLLILLLSPILTVQNLDILGGPRIDRPLVAQSLRSLFHHHLLFLSPSEVPPLLTQEIDGIGRPAVPDFSSVRVTKIFPNTLRVMVESTPLAYRLRVVEPTQTPAVTTASTSGSLLEFLTEDGRAVAYPLAAVGTGATLPLVSVVDWGARPSLWAPAIDPSLLALLRKAEAGLKAQFNVPVTDRTVYLRAQEVHLTVQRVSLWFDTHAPLERQLERYRIYRANAAGKAQRYIDLRLADRVVYR